MRHLTKQNKQVKPLPVPVIGAGEVLTIERKTRRSQKTSFQKVLKIPRIFGFSRPCILKNTALSIRCYPIMGQNMGQTVFYEFAEFISELFNP